MSGKIIKKGEARPEPEEYEEEKSGEARSGEERKISSEAKLKTEDIIVSEEEKRIEEKEEKKEKHRTEAERDVERIVKKELPIIKFHKRPPMRHFKYDPTHHHERRQGIRKNNLYIFDSLSEPFGYLSPLYPIDLLIGGKYYTSVSHFVYSNVPQFRKSYVELIDNERNEKNKERLYFSKYVESMNEVISDALRRGYMKLFENADYKELLIRTKGATLIGNLNIPIRVESGYVTDLPLFSKSSKIVQQSPKMISSYFPLPISIRQETAEKVSIIDEIIMRIRQDFIIEKNRERYSQERREKTEKIRKLYIVNEVLDKLSYDTKIIEYYNKNLDELYTLLEAEHKEDVDYVLIHSPDDDILVDLYENNRLILVEDDIARTIGTRNEAKYRERRITNKKDTLLRAYISFILETQHPEIIEKERKATRRKERTEKEISENKKLISEAKEQEIKLLSDRAEIVKREVYPELERKMTELSIQPRSEDPQDIIKRDKTRRQLEEKNESVVALDIKLEEISKTKKELAKESTRLNKKLSEIKNIGLVDKVIGIAVSSIPHFNEFLSRLYEMYEKGLVPSEITDKLSEEVEEKIIEEEHKVEREEKREVEAKHGAEFVPEIIEYTNNDVFSPLFVSSLTIENHFFPTILHYVYYEMYKYYRIKYHYLHGEEEEKTFDYLQVKNKDIEDIAREFTKYEYKLRKQNMCKNFEYALNLRLTKDSKFNPILASTHKLKILFATKVDDILGIGEDEKGDNYGGEYLTYLRSRLSGMVIEVPKNEEILELLRNNEVERWIGEKIENIIKLIDLYTNYTRKKYEKNIVLNETLCDFIVFTFLYHCDLNLNKLEELPKNVKNIINSKLEALRSESIVINPSCIKSIWKILNINLEYLNKIRKTSGKSIVQVLNIIDSANKVNNIREIKLHDEPLEDKEKNTCLLAIMNLLEILENISINFHTKYIITKHDLEFIFSLLGGVKIEVSDDRVLNNDDNAKIEKFLGVRDKTIISHINWFLESAEKSDKYSINIVYYSSKSEVEEKTEEKEESEAEEEKEVEESESSSEEEEDYGSEESEESEARSGEEKEE